jgi:DNA-binding SARP family transcriptional activator/ABC-type branched-subunit amino acid transport system substrate-binding protein
MARSLHRRALAALTAADRRLTDGYGRALDDRLDFRVLGPLAVRDGERELRLGGIRQRSLLAILLLQAPEPVAADRLIEELWGEALPEDAHTALHQHVSRLRKALEPHAVVITRPSGYAAEIADGALDLHRFERLCDGGRRALEAGRPDAAAATLREALGLWRGRPLADLDHEPFAREAIARLDEAWIEATELRIEADLALGRDAELVGELQTLVRRHPLRERPRRQLMLALYRSGRQAEALAAYADARATLVEELGLEPGQELQRTQRAILAQDRGLDAAPRRPATQRRRRRIAAGLGAAVAAAALAAAVVPGDGDRSAGAGPARANTAPGEGGELVAIDVARGTVGRRIAAGRTPDALATAGGRLWVVDADAGTLLAVDAATGSVETLATGATPTDVAAGEDAVWAANARPQERSQFVGPAVTELVQVDPATRTRRDRVALPAANGTASNRTANGIALSRGAVWAVTAAGAVVRVEPRTAAITASTRGLRAVAVAAGDAGVWALLDDASVVALDERTARVSRRVRLPTDAPSAIAVGAGAAWATSATDGMLWRIGRDGGLGSVEVGSGVGDVAAGAGGVWMANSIEGKVVAVDPGTMRVTRAVDVAGIPRAVALAGGTLWVALAGAIAPQSAPTAGVAPLPASICEPVRAGAGGRADVLVVSDLPLQGGVRVTATQMVQAIAFVLREHGFRAGRLRIAYQSCDDSIGRTGLHDEAKCAANARAYGASADVVAVIGTLNSPCAVAALPQLNRAPGGPLAMVSPLNSFVGLTRAAPGVPDDLLASLYPTGRRNYLRVFPTDDLQGAGLALLARDRGRRRVFVLDDGEPGYGVLMATGFTTAARRLGLRVTGRASWAPAAASYAALADRVAAARPQAVFVGGLLDSGGARIVRALRRRLGTRVDLLGPDGLTPLPLLIRRAGAAADGMFVSLGGAVTERLPPGGAAFVRRFSRTQPGARVDPSAVYAAQAAEVVLDAIARSDGTRASVLDRLFETHVNDGLLGDFAFDTRGDITESPVTVLRVSRGGSASEGGVVERVTRPSARLVAAAG